MNKRERIEQQISDLHEKITQPGQNPAVPFAATILAAQMQIWLLKADFAEWRELMNSNEELLLSFVEAMVPLRIYDIKRSQGWITDSDVKWAKAQVDNLSSGGDAVLYYVKNTSGKGIGVLCKCLAILAFLPGGITFCNLHFEVSEEA